MSSHHVILQSILIIKHISYNHLCLLSLCDNCNNVIMCDNCVTILGKLFEEKVLTGNIFLKNTIIICFSLIVTLEFLFVLQPHTKTIDRKEI